MSYELQIVSQHPDFQGKSLKKYNVDGDEIVGAFQNEPFEIVFKNNTYQKVQVKLAIDGTDILTGDLADTELSDKMWIVQARGELRLKAWPETNENGAQFVFTDSENGVATHLHGDMSSRGIIAAAVFTESYAYSTPSWHSGSYGILRGYSSHSILGSTICNASNSINASYSAEPTTSEYLSKAAVGAGQQVDQVIKTAAGLLKPSFDSIIKVKYAWWSDLVPKLEAGFVKQAGGSGFPGDKKRLMSLGNTPRLGEGSQVSPQPALSRF